MRLLLVMASALAFAVLARSAGGAAEKASADIVDTDGKSVGSAELTQGPQGVLVDMRVQGLPDGDHGFHIHAIGKCDPPSFELAGDHFNPDHKKHGLLNPDGPHAGDFPNVHPIGAGRVIVEMLAPDVTLKEGEPDSLLDEDGSALVSPADRDDLRSDPSGNSGDRIACGVIRK
jgi:Cu-Zn family superoxide dismutase